MKTKTIGTIARAINDDRKTLENNLNEFRAYWSKMYKEESGVALNAVIEAIKANGKATAEQRDERYTLECIRARAKSLELTSDIRSAIIELHDECGLKFGDITRAYLANGLYDTDYCDEGILMEQKTERDTGKKYWVAVDRWTPIKVAKYIRLANNNIQ